MIHRTWTGVYVSVCFVVVYTTNKKLPANNHSCQLSKLAVFIHVTHTFVLLLALLRALNLLNSLLINTSKKNSVLAHLLVIRKHYPDVQGVFIKNGD